jgi:hypothetical protein
VIVPRRKRGFEQGPGVREVSERPGRSLRITALSRRGPCWCLSLVSSHSAVSRSGMQISEIERSRVTVWVRRKRNCVGWLCMLNPDKLHRDFDWDEEFIWVSKQRCLDLEATRGRICEDKASAKTERKASGFKGVSAGRDVVHKIGLAEGQNFSSPGEVVLVWPN